MPLRRVLVGMALFMGVSALSFAAQPDSAALRGFKAAYPHAKILKEAADTAPTLITGLSAAVPKLATAEARGRAFISQYSSLFGVRNQADELLLKSYTALGPRRLLRFVQTYQGVPVWQGQMMLAFDRFGQVSQVTNAYKPVAFGLSTVPRISPREAIREAWARVYGTPSSEISTLAQDPKNTRLFVVVFGGQTHLAYAVALRHPSPAERREAFVDAQSGTFILQMDLVKYERLANVYEYNPGADGTKSTVQRQIPTLKASTDSHTYLVTDLHHAMNCTDKGETFSIQGFEVPICTQEPTAEADTDGNYLFDPVLTTSSDPAALDDKFSEVHLFYHVELIYQFFRDLSTYMAAHAADGSEPAFTTLRQVPLRCVANFKIPDFTALMSGGAAGLVPFDNAFFVPAGGLISGYPEEDSIMFGQGTTVDFSYDADVIYHEFTHAVIDTKVGLTSATLDQYGLVSDPGAMNEGYADFFSSTYTGDPNLAEYVGAALEQDGGTLRNMLNTKKCPDDASGEVHADSEYWAAALWAVRQYGLDNGKTLNDINGAVFSALLTLPQDASYAVASQATVDALKSWFDETYATAADGIFAARGLKECNRAIPVQDGVALGSTIVIYDRSTVELSPFVPGFVQFHFIVPEGKTVDYVQAQFVSNTGSLKIDYYMNAGGPVLFSFGSTISTDSKVVATADSTKRTKQGDYYTFTVNIKPLTGTTFAPGDYYLAMGNRSSGGGGMMSSGTYILQHMVSFKEGEITCTSSKNCNTCETCAESVCAPIVPDCTKDEDCAEGKYCKTSNCGGTCTTKVVPVDGDTDSADNDTAEAETEAEPEGTTCTTFVDCADCQKCVEGLCQDSTPMCTKDADCSAGMSCDTKVCGGTCVLIPVDGDSDTADSDLDVPINPPKKSSSGGCSGTGSANGLLALLALLGGLALARRKVRD